MDTTSHTSDCRLGIFAHRAAPVQLTYIGFWATTGLTEMDWIICDHWMPDTCRAHFREKCWSLPRSANAYFGDPSLSEGEWSPAADGTIWLGSFNKYSKIREECIALWSKVLRAIPEAKLLLEDRTPFDDQLHPRIVAEFARNGIDAGRIEFWPYTPGWRNHMLLYNRLDIALDTIPFNSGTTTYDALWMGVPLITLEGDWVGGRMANAVLRTLGKPEWVAQSEDEYVSIISALARNVELRKSLRKTQRALMAASELCDGKGLANGRAHV
jgi:protein O-GlcNAc transferase